MKITLVKKKAVVVYEEETANIIINNYFIYITQNLNLKPLDTNKFDTDIFENHISIKSIFKCIFPENFHFKEVSKLDIRNVKKSSTYGSIPASILKQCVDAYLPYLTDPVNYSRRGNIFWERGSLYERHLTL